MHQNAGFIMKIESWAWGIGHWNKFFLVLLVSPHTPHFPHSLLRDPRSPIPDPRSPIPDPQSHRRAVRTNKNKPSPKPKKLGSQAATKGERKPVSPNVRATCNVV